MHRWENLDKDLILFEASYGFVMALTFTTAHLLGFAAMERKELIVSILAMDFVWGVIDLILYYNSDIVAERRRYQLLGRLYSHENPESMRDEIYVSLEGTVFDSLDEESKLKAVEIVMNGKIQDRSTEKRDHKAYLVRALTAFTFSFSASFPAVLCISLIPDLNNACIWAAGVSALFMTGLGYLMSASRIPVVRLLFGGAFTLLIFALTYFAAILGG